MSSTAEKVKGPNPKQLRYLKNLALKRGESFVYPETSAQASAEIKRMLGRKASSAVEIRIERDQVSQAMSGRGGAAAVQDFEVSGYGSSAHWAGAR